MAHALLLAPLDPGMLTGVAPDLEVVVPGSQQEAVAAAEGAVLCIASWQAGGLVVDADVAAALAPTCRLVQVPAAGLDGIDLDACRDRGIPVSSAVGLNAVSVAEWCVWAVVDGLRGLAAAHAALQDGEWLMFAPRARHELRGRRVGIVGMGSIARELVPRLVPFGCELSYWSRSRHEDVELAHGVAHRELDDLVATSDVLVIAIASTPATAGLVSAERIAALPHGAVLVNVARAEVWDEQAVVAALAEGRLLSAVTDVFSTEPAPADHAVVGVPNLTTTPHVAGPTAEVLGAIMQRVVTNVTAVLGGDAPEGLVG